MRELALGFVQSMVGLLRQTVCAQASTSSTEILALPILGDRLLTTAGAVEVGPPAYKKRNAGSALGKLPSPGKAFSMTRGSWNAGGWVKI